MFLEDGGQWGKACLACHNLKKSCLAGRAEESEAEAGLSKKRRVEEGKGKGKEKAATPNSGVVESAATDVLQDILKELKGLRMDVGDLRVFAQHTTTMAENGWRTQRQISACLTMVKGVSGSGWRTKEVAESRQRTKRMAVIRLRCLYGQNNHTTNTTV